MLLKNWYTNWDTSGTQTMRDQNRHLQLRGKKWSYRRRVPSEVAHNDSRSPNVKVSLKTSCLQEARQKRDKLELADDAMWSALRAGQDADSAQERYDAAMGLEAITGIPSPSQPIEQRAFTHLIPRDIAVSGPIAEKLSEFIGKGDARRDELYADMDEHTQYAARLATLNEKGVTDIKIMSLAQGVDEPPVTVSAAFEKYLENLIAGAWSTKSANQLRVATNTKRRGVNNFIKAARDKPLTEITRKDAVSFFEYLRSCMTKAGTGKNNANRDLSTMRTLYKEHTKFTQVGLETPNPFMGLNFTETAGEEKSRTPFEWSFVRDKILAKTEILNKLDRDRRNALLVMIGIGARPGEIVNMLPENIHLDVDIPHIEIKPTADMAIKTRHSERRIPLIGFALDAMRDQGEGGFTNHRDKVENITGRINSWLKSNDLQPKGDETTYSLRHMFEDLGKDAAIEDEMRLYLFGHAVKRPKYGRGYLLESSKQALERMFLG